MSSVALTVMRALTTIMSLVLVAEISLASGPQSLVQRNTLCPGSSSSWTLEIIRPPKGLELYELSSEYPNFRSGNLLDPPRPHEPAVVAQRVHCLDLQPDENHTFYYVEIRYPDPKDSTKKIVATGQFEIVIGQKTQVTLADFLLSRGKTATDNKNAWHLVFVNPPPGLQIFHVTQEFPNYTLSPNFLSRASIEMNGNLVRAYHFTFSGVQAGKAYIPYHLEIRYPDARNPRQITRQEAYIDVVPGRTTTILLEDFHLISTVSPLPVKSVNFRGRS